MTLENSPVEKHTKPSSNKRYTRRAVKSPSGSLESLFWTNSIPIESPTPRTSV